VSTRASRASTAATALLWTLALAQGMAVCWQVLVVRDAGRYARTHAMPPDQWILGGVDAVAFEALLGEATRRSAPSARLLLAPPSDLGGAREHLLLWALYLYPTFSWTLTTESTLEPGSGDLLVAWRRPFDDPRFEPVLITDSGGLYRRRP